MSRANDTDEGSNADKSYTPSESNQLRAVLTELLNSDFVSADWTIRAWAQAQLMHVEQKIRRERCLHGDIETATLIATNLVSGCSLKDTEPRGSKKRPRER
jgi:hypothetical protein